MTDATSDTIQNHLSDTNKRKRFGWRLFWMLLAAFGFLIIGLPIVLYVSWQAHGRRLLRDELAAIKTKGEPITTAEMHAWYAIPVGERDITSIWLAAIEPFDTPAFNQSTGNLPIVGAGGPPPALNEPWADEAAIKQFLQQHEQEIAAIHTAAKERGAVQFSRDFSQGIGLLLPEAMKLRSAQRTLRLQVQQQLREKNQAAVMETLETECALAGIKERDVTVINLLVRIAMSGVALADINLAAETLPLTDEQLARLQELVRGMEIQQAMVDAMIGERATVYHAFHLGLGAWDGSMGSSGNLVFETTEDVSRISRPEDCATALKLLADVIAAMKEGPTAALVAGDDMEQELRALSGNGQSQINRWRYAQTFLLIPEVEAVGNTCARHVAQRDMTDCLLALRRYELKQGKLPDTLAELVPDYLPAVPNDAYDGQPLRYLITPESTCVYSIGEDRVDNGGQTDKNNLEPDMPLIYKAITK